MKTKKKTIITISHSDFRNTRYFEEMKMIYKNKKISDKDIIDYITNLNDSDIKSIKKDIKEIKEYAELKNKIKFQQLTIEIIRKKYWDDKTKKWKPIKYYYANGDDPNSQYGPEMVDKIKDRNNHSKVFNNEFIPNGDLIEINNKTKKEIIYKKWLESNKSGPYKDKDKDKDIFYYLGGKNKYPGDIKYDNIGIQICKNNYIAGNCINSSSWIEK